MNVKKLMEQAQQMQGKLEEELDALSVDASVGGGAVKVTMNGRKQLTAVEIDPGTLGLDDGDLDDGEVDVGLLQDLVLAAVNEAARQVDEQMQGKLGGMMPGAAGLF